MPRPAALCPPPGAARPALWLVAAGLLLGACDRGGPEPVAPRPSGGPSLVTSDGATGGNARFYFLPTLVPQPTYSGAADGALAPEVSVCDLGTARPTAASACVARVAHFTTTSGAGAQVVRYDARAEHYAVNWFTDQSSPRLAAKHFYRVTVRVGAVRLGYTDVAAVLSATDLRNAETGQPIPLAGGRTLPIKFRIERGAVGVVAVPAPGTPTAPVQIGSTGGAVALGDGSVAVAVPSGALAAPTDITVTQLASPPASPGLASPVYDFGPDGTRFAVPVTLTVAYDASKLQAGLPKSALRLYTRVRNRWERVAGSAADVEATTVSGQVAHFSEYAALVEAAGVTVEPAALALAPGGAGQLTATVTDAQGTVLTDRAVAWTTSDAGVATVDNAGLVTGVAAGSATITATSEGRSGTAAVTVSAGQLAVYKSWTQVGIGQVQALHVRFSPTPSAPVPITVTQADAAVTSTSVWDPQISDYRLVVLVTGRAVGTDQITVSAPGYAPTTTVPVAAAVSQARFVGIPATMEVGSEGNAAVRIPTGDVSAPITVELSTSPNLAVTDVDGNVISSITVLPQSPYEHFASPLDPRDRGLGLTAESLLFRWKVLGPGEGWVRATHPNFTAAYRTVTVTEP